MADSPNIQGIAVTLLALGLAPVIGMAIGGGAVAAVLFVAAAGIVIARALRRHTRALADPDPPMLASLTPQQAIGMLSALRGQPLAASMLARVDELAKLAERAPEDALVQLEAVLREAPRSVPALALCARLELALDRPDAAARWALALARALDSGTNAVAARLFVEHREHRERLQLDAAHLRALANALRANGHGDDAQWCLTQATTARAANPTADAR